MEATELRLNNLLMYGDSIVPIMGVENNNESVLVKIDEDTAIDYRKLKPIALTVDWFSKLGSKKLIAPIAESDSICQIVAVMILIWIQTKF
jgi:hypothetical protein